MVKEKEKEKNPNLSVYDFGVDDRRVEKQSKKFLSKFKPEKTTKFSGDSPVDKFTFLHSFEQVAKAEETCSKNESLAIKNSNDNVEQITCPSNVAERSTCLNPKASSHSPVENCSPGAISYFCDGKKPRRRISFDEIVKIFDPQLHVNNQPLTVDSDDDEGNLNLFHINVDSDDDCKIELRSSISAPYLARNNASVSEQPSDHGSTIFAVEKVVVVKPDIIFFAEICSTDATLTFSNRYIKVKGSTINGMDNSFTFNWSVSDIVKIESSWYKEVETARVELYLKSGDEKFAEVSEVTKLDFAICDHYWSERQEAIESLDKIYKATWNTVIDFNKAFEGIIYPRGDPDAVSISMKDVQLLQPATFINDTIVDFYINFFFRKLVDDKSPSTAFDGRAAFQRVCKWTRKVNLFEKDYLFIPVNFSLHWSLMIVCHPGEVVYCEDKEMENSFKYPCILHMDSIKGSHKGLKNVFQSYLLEEWKERCNELPEDVSNKFLNLPFKSLELPQQENSFDCGLFLLYFVERFLEEAPVNFSLHESAYRFLNKKWFPPAEASGRRGYIKKILYKIINNNVQKGPPITDYYDSPQNEMEGGTGKELQQTRNERGMRSYSTPNADKKISISLPEATNIRRFRYSGVNLLLGDSLGLGETRCSVTEGTYQRRRQLESKWSHGIVSPGEEEETKGEQTAFLPDKASSRFSERTLIAPLLRYKNENMEMTSETVVRKFPISMEIRDDENLVPDDLLVSTHKERTVRNEPLSASYGELHSAVVEDSYESGNCGINDIGNRFIREAESLSMSESG